MLAQRVGLLGGLGAGAGAQDVAELELESGDLAVGIAQQADQRMILRRPALDRRRQIAQVGAGAAPPRPGFCAS